MLKTTKIAVDIRDNKKVFTIYTNLKYLKLLITTKNIEVIGLDYLI